MKWHYAKVSLSRCCCDQEYVFAVYSEQQYIDALEQVNEGQREAQKTRNYDFMQRGWPMYKMSTRREIDKAEMQKAIDNIPQAMAESADILTRNLGVAKKIVRLLEDEKVVR